MNRGGAAAARSDATPGPWPGVALCGLVLVLGVAAAPAAADRVGEVDGYLARMDTDGDGWVSLDEYLAWMTYAFERMDRNGDGVLGGDELPGGRGATVTLGEHRVRLTARFNRQDANGDGFLDARELAAPPR